MILRGVFVVVSLFGIVYEISSADSIRWPLILGYCLVIAISAYVTYHEMPEQRDEPE